MLVCMPQSRVLLRTFTRNNCRFSFWNLGKDIEKVEECWTDVRPLHLLVTITLQNAHYFHLTFREVKNLSVRMVRELRCSRAQNKPRSAPSLCPCSSAFHRQSWAHHATAASISFLHAPQSSLPICLTWSGKFSENVFPKLKQNWFRQHDKLGNFPWCFSFLISKMEVIIYFLYTIFLRIK